MNLAKIRLVDLTVVARGFTGTEIIDVDIAGWDRHHQQLTKEPACYGFKIPAGNSLVAIQFLGTTDQTPLLGVEILFVINNGHTAHSDHPAVYTFGEGYLETTYLRPDGRFEYHKVWADIEEFH